MTKKSEHSHHPGSQHRDHSGHSSKRWAPHKDWRLWTAVVLMLGAMTIYVLSISEMFPLTDSAADEPVPADVDAP